MERANWRAHGALLLMVLIWAVNFSVSKVALSAVEPLAFNALRFPMAAALLYVVLRRRGPIPRPERRDVARLLAVSVFGNFVYQMCFIFGLDRTSAGNAALLLAASPILTALLSAATGHERVSGRVWAGVIATFVGILLVVLGGHADTELSAASIAGDVIMFGASMTWAFYTVGARPLVQRYGATAVTAWTLWAGTVLLVLAGLPALSNTSLRSLSAFTWASIVYAGVFSIGLAYMIWYYGVKKIGNTRTASYSNVTPVLALIVAWLWLGEVPTLAQMLGAAIIIGGITTAQSA